MKKTVAIAILMLALIIALPAQTSVVIDVTKEKTPISKYIYGQFIEHLGKSVYSGLWAEMILDRKFCYPITDKYDPWGIGEPDAWWGGSQFPYLKGSPWKIVGTLGTVSMDSISPYCGNYAALVKPADDGIPTGISQDALSLVEGKAYSGRIILSGITSALPIVVSVVVDNVTISEINLTEVDTIYKTFPINFTSSVNTDSATLKITSTGGGWFKIGTLSLMPADNIDGWRADLVALLKELNSPIYRWPGGNFVSGYNWRDGIGDIDKRAPRKNQAWTGIEPNDVGIHEFMNLMNILNSDPFIAINMGLGSVEEGIAEVEYCNADTNTVGGKLRANNGHSESFEVKYWAVGNEMFGNWQLGYMPIADYQIKNNMAAEGIWAVDSTAQLVAVGDVGLNWSSPMLQECGDYMNLISEHKYCKENTNLVSHINALGNEIKGIASAHRNYLKNIPGLAEKNIRIAMDEYNYWYGPNPYGQLGVIYHQKDGLGVAVALNEFIKNSDLFFMANYAQTVNVLGCIKTTPTASAFETTALPLMLYRKHFGEIPVEVTGTTTKLNVSAAFTNAKDSLTIAIVNALDIDVYYKIDLRGAKPLNGYLKWTIANTNPNAYNEPGKEPVVKIIDDTFSAKIDSILIPAYAVVMVKFPVEATTSIGSFNEETPNFNIFPNPVENSATIEYQLKSDSQVQLSILDTSGHEISKLYMGSKVAGIYSEIWETKNFVNGIYFCKLAVDEISLVQKIVLIKN